MKGRPIFIAGVLALLAACTTVSEVRRPDGSTEFLVACGASTGWDICYSRANETCPTGWTTLSQQGGFNRKELRISCPGAQRPPR